MARRLGPGVLSLLLLVVEFAPQHGLASSPAPDWSGWPYGYDLSIANGAAVGLPADYTVRLSMDTAALIDQGRLRSDCADLRISDESRNVELDRWVESCDSPSTIVSFSLEHGIVAGAVDGRYRLHFGNPSASSPPDDAADIFLFYDDFEDGSADGWLQVEGEWVVLDEGSNRFYRCNGHAPAWVLSYVDLPDSADVDYTARIRASDDPLTTSLGVAFRILDGANFLTASFSRPVADLRLDRVQLDYQTTTQSLDYSMPGGTWHRVRVRTVGDRIRVKVWPDGIAEPANWPIDVHEPVFADRGGVGADYSFRSSVNADWDDFIVRRAVEPEPVVTLLTDEHAWHSGTWGFRRKLFALNTSMFESLRQGYSLQIVLDTSTLVAAGKLQSACDDLRIFADDGTTSTELDRIVTGCGTQDTRVWFSARRPIAPATGDAGYYLYYGNPSASGPPADGMQVFVFHENWEQGTVHWTSAAGLDSTNSGAMGSSVITVKPAVSPTRVQEFRLPFPNLGGDAYSGRIPVEPATGYAIDAWGRSPLSGHVPFGYETYDATLAPQSSAWLWTDEWTLAPGFSFRSAPLTTGSGSVYLRIRNESHDDGGVQAPVYIDNVSLRYAIDVEPGLSGGDEWTVLPSPSLDQIADDGPITVGDPVSIWADITSSEGTIATVMLEVLEPEVLAIPMQRIAGNATDGTWEISFVPVQGGEYRYRVTATSSLQRTSYSPSRTFAVVDELPPLLGPVDLIDPILVGDTQVIELSVADAGLVTQVALTLADRTVALSPQPGLWAYSWKVESVGVHSYSITATDSASNQATISGSFHALARDVDICRWRSCKPGAASFSVDDGKTQCRAEMEANGFRGTYYYNGTTTKSWFADYAGSGHEIAAHTVSHPCYPPCCFPTCTPLELWQCAWTSTDVENFRRDELEPNIAAIEAGTGVPVQTLAWPCGSTDGMRMAAASASFIGTRGFFNEVANLYWVQSLGEATPVEPMNLNASNSFNRGMIDRAALEGKWYIRISHSDCNDVDYIGDRLDVLWAAPVGEVLEYIQVRDAATRPSASRTGSTIVFVIPQALSPMQRTTVDGAPMSTLVFDVPVTLKIHILPGEHVTEVRVDGSGAPFGVQNLDGVNYVLVDVALDSSHEIVVALSSPYPTNAPVLAAAPTNVSWDAMPDAVAYDVVWGDLDSLRSSRGDFTESTIGCLADDTDTISIPFDELPGVGEGIWTLVRPLDASGAGSYNTGTASQPASRDAAIQAAPNTCF